MALYQTKKNGNGKGGEMRKSWYYSIMFFLCCIWCNVATSTEARVLLVIAAICYAIDMIVSAYRGE